MFGLIIWYIVELYFINGLMFFDFYLIFKGFDIEDEYNNLYIEKKFFIEILV